MKTSGGLSLLVRGLRMSWLVSWIVLGGFAFAAPVAQSRYFLASDGALLHYFEAGSGRTMVFVPGWTMPADIWQPQIDYFSQRFRVIAFDPRSQGKSDIAAVGHNAERRAQDILELIGTVGSRSAILVTWSLGVLESLALIHYFGDQSIDALVLVDNSVGEDPAPKVRSDFIKRLRSDREATVTAFVRSMFKTPQPEDYLDELSRKALRTPLEASVALLSYNYPRTFWRQSLYATRKPILYAVTPRFAGQASNVREKHPSASIEVFQDAGHALFVDEPQRFNALVDGFIRRSLDCDSCSTVDGPGRREIR